MKIRIISVLVFALALNAAVFGVLYAEEWKRLSAREAALRDLASEMEAADRSRKEYYESIARQKEDLRKQMADSEQNYRDLLEKQPDLVAGSEQRVTKIVEQVVPVTTTQTAASKPKSTKSTKTS